MFSKNAYKVPEMSFLIFTHKYLLQYCQSHSYAQTEMWNSNTANKYLLSCVSFKHFITYFFGGEVFQDSFSFQFGNSFSSLLWSCSCKKRVAVVSPFIGNCFHLNYHNMFREAQRGCCRLHWYLFTSVWEIHSLKLWKTFNEAHTHSHTNIIFT